MPMEEPTIVQRINEIVQETFGPEFDATWRAMEDGDHLEYGSVNGTAARYRRDKHRLEGIGKGDFIHTQYGFLSLDGSKITVKKKHLPLAQAYASLYKHRIRKDVEIAEWVE
jgi:hypothetical protein